MGKVFKQIGKGVGFDGEKDIPNVILCAMAKAK
jgi:hypothetical protein